jgi:hypothetical protein
MADGNTRSREVIAHHEAAHAVVAIELGVGILDIGIDMSRFDETGGVGLDGCRLFVADLTDVTPQEVESEQLRLAGQIDRTGAVLAAGAAAEARLADEDAWVALHRQSSDIKKMRDLLALAQLAPSEEATNERLRLQLEFSVEVLADPEVWQAVGAVAEAVLARGPMTGPQVEQIVEAILAPSEPV